MHRGRQTASYPSDDRIRAVLASVQLSNGTQAADLVITALNADPSLAVGQPRRSISDAAIHNLGVELVALLARGSDPPVTLSGGYDVRSVHVGGFTIGDRSWAIDVDHPGLHPRPTLPRAAGGSNLVRLLEQIVELTSDLPCRSIGLPAPAFVEQNMPAHVLQFPPCAEVGGVILRRDLDSIMLRGRFCSLDPRAIREFAESIVQDMRELLDRSAAIRRHVERATKHGRRAASESPGVRFRGVSIDLSYQPFLRDDSFAIGIEYESHDTALRPSVVVDYVESWDALGRYQGPPKLSRTAEAIRLRAQGADGRIDHLARAIVEAAPGGPALALAQLGKDYRIIVGVPTRAGIAAAELYWREGVIRAKIDKGPLRVSDRQVIFKDREWPETIIDSLPDRRLNEIADLPFDCNAIIVEAVGMDGDIHLEVDNGTSLLNCGTGKIW